MDGAQKYFDLVFDSEQERHDMIQLLAKLLDVLNDVEVSYYEITNGKVAHIGVIVGPFYSAFKEYKRDARRYLQHLSHEKQAEAIETLSSVTDALAHNWETKLYNNYVSENKLLYRFKKSIKTWWRNKRLAKARKLSFKYFH